MVDFRKLISPKTRAYLHARRDRMLAFQAQGRAGMATSLVESSRALADSGLFRPEQPSSNWSYDEWAIYRCIPALAKRLNPDLELRADEIAKPEEMCDPVTWIEAGDDRKLLSSINSIISHASFTRAEDGCEEVKAAADFLLEYRSLGSAISVAMDTLVPGSFQARTEPDVREPLPGVQLIASYPSGYDRVLKYAETEADLDQGFRVAEAMRLGDELSDEDEPVARSLRYPLSVTVDYDALSIQDYDGTVLRERSFVVDGSVEPVM